MNNLVSEKKKGLTVKLLAILLSIIFLCTIIVPVNITTALAAEGDQDRNFIVVQKTFDGIKEEQIPGKFAISVSNGSNSYTLNKDNAEKSSGLVWRWKVMDAAAGTYNVTESNADIEGYDLSTAGLGSVTVKAAELNVTGIKRETTCSHTNWPVDEGQFFASALTGGGIVVITEHTLSAGQRKAIENAILDGASGNWKAPFYFYSIDEQIKTGNGFNIVVNGKTRSVTYDFDKHEMIIGDTSEWTHVLTATYDISAAVNPDLAITNTYTKKVTDVTITKNVTGNMGDLKKDFSFIAKIENAPANFTPTGGDGYIIENGEYKFGLKDDESVTLKELPLGATIFIKETNADKYTITVKNGDSVISDENGDGWYKATVTKDLSIFVENHYQLTPDVGITLDSWPYIILLGIAVIGSLAALLVRRHSHND